MGRLCRQKPVNTGDQLSSAITPNAPVRLMARSATFAINYLKKAEPATGQVHATMTFATALLFTT
ncbi:hypothetical protein BDIM_14540 [Brevundimonas diminuta ATCC 11568]|nr:hypothetical protein BDIM_14540 [Brevundimonas diminuta ATCC 11568]